MGWRINIDLASFSIKDQFVEKVTMKTIKNFYALFLPVLFLLLMLPLIAGHLPALAENPELSTVVFYVE
jgi:hypothetical protein